MLLENTFSQPSMARLLEIRYLSIDVFVIGVVDARYDCKTMFPKKVAWLKGPLLIYTYIYIHIYIYIANKFGCGRNLVKSSAPDYSRAPPYSRTHPYSRAQPESRVPAYSQGPTVFLLPIAYAAMPYD